MPILSQSVFLIQVIPGLDEGLKTNVHSCYQHHPACQYCPNRFLTVQVIPGLDEGLKTMSTGGIRRLYIPGELAFPKGLPAGESRLICAAPHGSGLQQAAAAHPRKTGRLLACRQALHNHHAQLKQWCRTTACRPTSLPCLLPSNTLSCPALQPRAGRACRPPVPWCLMCSCCTSPAFRTTRSRAEHPNDLKLDWQPCKHAGAAPLLAAGVRVSPLGPHGLAGQWLSSWPSQHAREQLQPIPKF